jgi:hypothetical protein
MADVAYLKIDGGARRNKSPVNALIFSDNAVSCSF